MGKISYEDKMRIQTFEEIGFGYKIIVNIFLKMIKSLAR